MRLIKGQKVVCWLVVLSITEAFVLSRIEALILSKVEVLVLSKIEVKDSSVELVETPPTFLVFLSTTQKSLFKW